MTLEQKRARVLRKTPLYYAPMAPLCTFIITSSSDRSPFPRAEKRLLPGRLRWSTTRDDGTHTPGGHRWFADDAAVRVENNVHAFCAGVGMEIRLYFFTNYFPSLEIKTKNDRNHRVA